MTTNQMLYLVLIRSGIGKQVELMAATGRAKSTVHRMVTLLAERNYITRQVGGHGGLQLTPAGAEAVAQMALICQRGKRTIGLVRAC